MRIGLSTGAFYGEYETEDAAALMPQLPVTCCEVFLETYSEYNADFGLLVKSRLCGIPAVSIHVESRQFEAGMVGRSKRQQADSMYWFEHALQAGQALGASIYVFHGPTLHSTPPSVWRNEISNALTLAEHYGITFAWENVAYCALATPERVREARDTWPSLQFVLDIKQAFRAHVPVNDLIDAMAGRICHVHVCDVRADGTLALPGQGTFNFASLAQTLRATGYQGDLILEPYSAMCKDHAMLRASLCELMRACGIA